MMSFKFSQFFFLLAIGAPATGGTTQPSPKPALPLSHYAGAPELNRITESNLINFV